MRNSLIGLAIIFGIFDGFFSNDVSAFQTSLPETDVPIQMDSFFKGIKPGIARDAIKSVRIQPNNVAWKKSVITGKIGSETVYRFQTRYGIHNEGKHDLEDQDRYKKSRSEYTLLDADAFWEGDHVTFKYSFYVPQEIKLPGIRTHVTGQWKNRKAGTIVYSIQTAPALDAIGVFDDWYKKSEYADMAIQPQDLIFQYRGILGNDSKNYKSHAIPLARKDTWQGKWNNVEITTHISDKGSFRFVFNGKTIIDCSDCDTMPNEKHDHFYEDEWAYERSTDILTLQFGVYQFAHDPMRIDPKQNVNSVVYMKDIVVQKTN